MPELRSARARGLIRRSAVFACSAAVAALCACAGRPAVPAGGPRPAFDPWFYAELVHDCRDRPSRCSSFTATPAATVMRRAPDVVFAGGGSGGRLERARAALALVALPHLSAQFSAGRPGPPAAPTFRTGGSADEDACRRSPTCVVLDVAKPRPYPGRGSSCGSATPWVQLSVYADCALGAKSFLILLAHEYGHAVGLWHVDDPLSLMHPRPDRLGFSEKDLYHARLGVDAAPPGFPFETDDQPADPAVAGG